MVTARTPTLAELLELPVLARGLPEVVAGRVNLSRRVRWVHINEWASPASSLHGGELILTTGIGFPADLERYSAELVEVDAAGLVLELGRCYQWPPETLVQGCRRHGLPLVALRRGVKFVDVTQEAHEMIMGGQLTTLREAVRIHDTFTGLTVRGADAEDVVATAAKTAGRAVVLENLTHQALICHPADQPIEHVLNRWEARSRVTPTPDDRTGLSGPEGWLLASMEFRGQRSGRLAMLPGTSNELEFRAEHVMVLERAALALTITRFARGSTWVEQAHRSALHTAIEQRYRSVDEMAARLAALGVPTMGRRLVMVLAAPVTPAAEPVAVGEGLGGLLEEVGTRVVIGALDAGRVGALVPVEPAGDWRTPVKRTADLLRDKLHGRAVVGVGSPVTDLTQIPRSFAEAEQVVNAIPPGSSDSDFYELSDVDLGRLLYSMRDDVRVQAFAERRLSGLLAYEQRHGTDLLISLRCYLDAAGNKSIAARRANVSRQALYKRLRTLQDILDCDLDNGAVRSEFQVAIAAMDAQRGEFNDGSNRGPRPAST